MPQGVEQFDVAEQNPFDNVVPTSVMPGMKSGNVYGADILKMVTDQGGVLP
jgi:hypothetical protein